jgi:hypothetical protein
MSKQPQCPGRRRFLKASAAGAAGAVVSGLASKRIIAGPVGLAAEPAWQDDMQIHPDIDNLRVTFCHDPEMVTGLPSEWSIEAQNAVVNEERLKENMDRMAVALADLQVADPGDLAANASAAWAHIFQKPAGKEWDQTNVALKINCIEAKNVSRLAITGKVCDELHALGVPYGNMHIYDGCHWRNTFTGSNENMQYLQSYFSQGVNILGRGGTAVQAEMPDGEMEWCVPEIYNGEMDIIVNFALNKGHGSSYGSFTAALKNHLGTVRYCQELPAGAEASQHPGEDGNRDKVITINLSKEILGEGLPPRQQLCIVDSLWAMTHGPTGDAPNRAPHSLVMGTFAVSVDHLTATKIREGDSQDYQMGMNNVNHNALDIFWNAFGYDPNSDEIQNLDWVDIETYEPRVVSVGGKPLRQGDCHEVHISLPAAADHSLLTFTGVPKKAQARIGIYTMKGRLVRSLSADGKKVAWDGRDGRGAVVRPGAYVIRLRTGKYGQSQKVNLL